MAWKMNGKRCYASADFTMKSFDDKNMRSIYDFDNTEGRVELKVMNYFKPMCAMTVYTAQGMAINRPYSICEYKRTQHDVLYVALTRTSKQGYVKFCDSVC